MRWPVFLSLHTLAKATPRHDSSESSHFQFFHCLTVHLPLLSGQFIH
ncbi:Uncharacterised protein [Edwardsiella tarda]|nr:Uncharacterised protein [Edwardsiella tarda]STD49208.1 Uncharacterised protein [Edwardsiella tarda]